MIRWPELGVRARLTALSVAVFAGCGVVIVAVSYTLVARLEPQGRSKAAPPSFLERCRLEQVSAHPNGALLAKCDAFFQLQGAERQRQATLSHLLAYSLATFGIALVLAAALSWIAAGHVLRPLKQITAAARAASEHNLAARVALNGPRDELRDLADTFDGMLEQLQQAFESQRRFIADASHELRTPLAVMRASVDVVLDNPSSTSADLHGMATDIRAAVDHAERLIAALLVLARNERGHPLRAVVDLATVTEDALETVDVHDRSLHMTLDRAETLGDVVLLERLVSNLIENAVRYNDEDGDIWITTTTTEAGAQLVVANAGRMLDPGDETRIFEPFHRLEPRTSHDGFGLGLALVSSIASAHGGKASATRRNEGGLTVTVSLPAADRRPR